MGTAIRVYSNGSITRGDAEIGRIFISPATGQRHLHWRSPGGPVTRVGNHYTDAILEVTHIFHDTGKLMAAIVEADAARDNGGDGNAEVAALALLRSIVSDVSAMRVRASDIPAGYGDDINPDYCFRADAGGYLDDDQGTFIEWPNLAILIDEAKLLLDT